MAQPAADPAAPGSVQSEALGRRIYLTGVGEDGREITAILDGGTELPASALPCASCHGGDGRGRAEGGLSPSDITWPSLTRPYGAQRPSGRVHPPYDAYLVKRAVTMGVDAGGHRLHVAMPRYQLTHAEAAALIAYLQRLADELDPGIEEDRVRLGAVLPPVGTAAGLGGAVRAALEAASSRINDAGGIYNRHLELRFLEPPAAPQARRQAVIDFLTDERIFALVASFIAGADAEIAAAVARAEVPLIGPFSLEPQTGFPVNRQVFYLGAGFPEQGRALIEFAARQPRPRGQRAVIVQPRQAIWRRVAEAIRDQGSQLGQPPWASISTVAYPAGRFNASATARAERDAGTDSVFFLGSAREAAALLDAARELGWAPYCFLLGPLVNDAVFAAATSFVGRLFLSFATLPTDTSPRAYANYRALATLHALPPSHVADQLAALAAFELLVEALEQTGRELSREKLIANLEGLYQFPGAFTPALTYGPNRRIGALGAYVVAADLENRRPEGHGEWISLR